MTAVTFTDPSVFEGIARGESWADPVMDPTRINWAERMASAVIPFRVVDGRPVSPLPCTSVRYGRNELGHWGEQVCADAVVIAADHDGASRWLLMVERSDGHGWAVPGGYVEPGEDPAAAAVRELEEETGLRLDGADWQVLPARGVPDPRASDEAWMVTVPLLIALTVDGPDSLPVPVAADDAKRAEWVRADTFTDLEARLSDLGGCLFPAHRDLVAAVLLQ